MLFNWLWYEFYSTYPQALYFWAFTVQIYNRVNTTVASVPDSLYTSLQVHVELQTILYEYKLIGNQYTQRMYSAVT